MREEHTDFLTTRQLARMWQVSEATIKRWADAGRLHPARTVGGHRRFALSEVLRFQNEQGLSPNTEARRKIEAAALKAQTEKRPGTEEADAAERFFEAI